MFSLACVITPLFLATTLFIQGMYEVIIFFKIPLSIPDSRKSPLYFKPPQSLHNIYIYYTYNYIHFFLQTKTRFKSNEVIYSHKSSFKLCKLSNWNSVIWTHCHSCIIDVESFHCLFLFIYFSRMRFRYWTEKRLKSTVPFIYIICNIIGSHLISK